MDFIEVSPLPEICKNCRDRLLCIENGEGEWCCDECDLLGERFVCVASPLPPTENAPL